MLNTVQGLFDNVNTILDLEIVRYIIRYGRRLTDFDRKLQGQGFALSPKINSMNGNTYTKNKEAADGNHLHQVSICVS
jgi:hypothetical protein